MRGVDCKYIRDQHLKSNKFYFFRSEVQNIPQKQDNVEFLGLEKGQETFLLLIDLVGRRGLILVLRQHSRVALHDGDGGVLGQRRGSAGCLHGDLVLRVGHGEDSTRKRGMLYAMHNPPNIKGAL